MTLNKEPSSEFANFGGSLRYLRLKSRLTQRELALAVGYSEAQINRLEKNLRLPDAGVVAARFLDALDLRRDATEAKQLIELATKARGDASSVRQEQEASARTNLPAPLTSFIGRVHEMAEVKVLLSSARLLSLIGAGGVGKTRLAQETAAVLLDTNAYADGIWFVELAALADSALVPQSVAATLKLTERPGRTPLDAVADYFAGKQALLILDNCEHLIAACASLAEQLLKRCSGLHVLTTSRETLHIPGEVVYRVPSLSFPDLQQWPSVERLLEFEAVCLFVDRTRRTLSDFTLTAQNAEPLVQVCQRLDGIPLAIELAAARMTMMSVEQIAARLDDRFHLLTGGNRSALPQHKTLRALIDWSYDLLTEAEQTLLRRLSVFAGGWTLEATEAVIGYAIGDGLDMLTQLVNKSLVTVEREDVGQTRYRLLETIRQYAQDRLQERGEVEPTRDRHLNYFLQFAKRAEPELRRADQITWLDRLEAELGNFRAALGWSLQRGCHAEAGLRLAAVLMWFWHIRDHRREGSDWLERVLAAEAYICGAEPQPQTHILARTNALNAVAFLMAGQGYFTKQTTFSEEALALSRKLGDGNKCVTAFALWILADAACEHQNYGQAQTLFEESLALYQEAADKFGVAECLYVLGGILLVAGDYEGARVLQEKGLALRKEIGDKDGMAETYRHLGNIALWQGDLDRAALMYDTSITLFDEVGNKWAIGRVRSSLASVFQARGDYEEAVRQSNQTLTLRQNIGSKFSIVESHYDLGNIFWSKGEYEQAAWHYVEALTLYREPGDKSVSADAMCGLGHVALAQGDPEQATERFEEALAIGRNPEVKYNIANALSGLAQVAQARRDDVLAYALCKEVLVLLHDTHDQWELVRSLAAFAVVAVALRQARQAVRLFGAIETLYELIRWTQSPFERDAHEGAVAGARSQLDEAIFAAEWARGTELTLEGAVAFALDIDEDRVAEHAESAQSGI